MAKNLLKVGVITLLVAGLSLWAPLASVQGAGGSGSSGNSGGSGGLDMGSIFGAISTPQDLHGLLGQFAGIFGGMGSAGSVFAQVLSLLMSQGLNLTGQEEPGLPGLYVLNATNSTTVPISEDLGGAQTGTYYPDWNYYEMNQTDITNAHNSGSSDVHVGYPYCNVSRNGSGLLIGNVTYGLSITILLWDSDGSLITALSKVVAAVQKVSDDLNTANEKSAIQDAVSAVLYLLVHINDIITGDELIVVNPISYTTVFLNGTFGETHAWYVPVWNGTDYHVQPMNSFQDQLILASWEEKANAERNGFMSWLLNGNVTNTSHQVTWGSFSFDLLQIWLKRFHVSIDMSALTNMATSKTQNPNPATILKDLDIEFYIIWHHLMGSIFYNSTNDGLIDVSYVNATQWDPSSQTQKPIIAPDGTVVQRPNATNVEYLLVLKSIGSVQWESPQVVGNSLTWGARFNNVQMYWLPPGVDPQSYASQNSVGNATLQFIDLGFSFTPSNSIDILDENGQLTGVTGKDADIKLNQAFGEWNPLPQNVAGMGFSVIYVSAILHVHFTGAMLAKSSTDSNVWNEEGNTTITPNSTRVTTQKSFTFGRAAEDQLANNPVLGKVDIAGPNYQVFNPADSTQSKNLTAASQVIPIGLFAGVAQATSDYTDPTMVGGGFNANAYLGVDFAVVAYAVDYPQFGDYPGWEIIHDPTFSIFITFNSTTYWAVLLLIGVLALVGIAAVMITRAKNNR